MIYSVATVPLSQCRVCPVKAFLLYKYHQPVPKDIEKQEQRQNTDTRGEICVSALTGKADNSSLDLLTHWVCTHTLHVCTCTVLHVCVLQCGLQGQKRSILGAVIGVL